MILALDVGNTNIVAGCIDEHSLHFGCRIATDREKTDMEYAVLFKNILDVHKIDPRALDGAIISSVVPPLNHVLAHALETLTGSAPMEVNVHMNHGLQIDLDTPDLIGSDLIVGAVAALDRFRPPLIIFDLGTTTTISVIDKQGVYRGGAFLPGIQISLDALSARTSQLPSISFDAPGNIIAKNTVDYMKSGIVYGNAAMMDGMIDRIEAELGEKTTIVATGGLASFVTTHCVHEIHLDDDLLLKGLLLLYNKNKEA